MPEAPAAAPVRAKEYEAIYVLRPDIESDAAGKIATRVSEVIAREKGAIVKVESWGRRKLAYPVRKYKRGIYYYVKFIGGRHIVAEFERNLRMQRDAVLKFMTIKTNDEVDVDSVQIDPEEIKFADVEPQGEDDVDESREKELGLVDYHELRAAREERERAAAEAHHAARVEPAADASDDSKDDQGGVDADADEEN